MRKSSSMRQMAASAFRGASVGLERGVLRLVSSAHPAREHSESFADCGNEGSYLVHQLLKNIAPPCALGPKLRTDVSDSPGNIGARFQNRIRLVDQNLFYNDVQHAISRGRKHLPPDFLGSALDCIRDP